MFKRKNKQAKQVEEQIPESMKALIAEGHRLRSQRSEEVKQILEKMAVMLLEMGFKETVITNPYRNEVNYVYGNLYCIPEYLESIGFIMEYAGSFEEAQKHFHEDGDSFPLAMGEEAILSGLANEVRLAINQQS